MKNYIFYAEQEMTLENEGKVQLKYSIIEDIKNSRISNIKIYGVSIEKVIGEEMIEKEIAEGITYSREYIDLIIDILYRNSVTPCVMLQSVDDVITTIQEALA